MAQTKRKSRRNVKSQNSAPVDAHEKGKNYLTEPELEQLLGGTKGSRYRIRDTAIILLMFRHGLRVSELVSLRLNDFDPKTSRLWVTRGKGGLSTEHPVEGDALRALKRYLKTRTDHLPWLVVSERGTQLTRQSINYLLRRAGERAGLPIRVHPHMLRHGCGYALANRGYDLRLLQDYLGHRDPRHTAIYTRTASRRFDGLWR